MKWIKKHLIGRDRTNVYMLRAWILAEESPEFETSPATYFTAVRKHSQPSFSVCGNARPYLKELLREANEI